MKGLRFKGIKRDILNGNVLQQLIFLAFPLYVGYLLQQIYTFVDSIVLGRFVGKQALASVGGSPTIIINIILNLISGICSAVMVMVAQNHGRGNSEKVNDTIRSAFYLSIVLGGVLSVAMIGFSRQLLILLKSPEETMQMSLTYMYLYFASLVPYFVYQTGISIMRGLGDSRRPIYFILMTAVSKIGLDLLLAGVFKLGVLGTSIATFASHVLCAALVLAIFYYTPDIYHYSLKDFGFGREDMRDIVRIGVPFSIQSIMFALPNTLIQARINGFGTDAVAAFSTYSNVDTIFWVHSNAVGTATITMVGQNFGYGRKDRVRKTFYASILLEAIGCVAYGLLFYNTGTHIIRLFTGDPDVIQLAKTMLDMSARCYLIYVMVEAVSATLKGCGRAKAIMYIAAVTICLSRIVFVLFAPIRTATDVPYAYPISWALTAVAYTAYYYLSKITK